MRILLVFLLFFSPLAVFAQSIVINEIAWMGTPTTGVEEKQWWRYEWLELRSTTVGTVVLDGWTVELSRPASAEATAGKDKIDFTVPLSGTIPADGYFLIGASDKILNLDLNYNNLGGKFNNSGQRVVLKNAAGEIVDEVDARSGWPAGDNKTKQTMERVEQGWQTSADSGGTPKASNSVVQLSRDKEAAEELSLIKFEAKLNQTKEGTKSDLVQGQTEKDLVGSSWVELDSVKFQSRVPIVNPITLLAGLLALGFSGALLALKQFLALRQRSGQASRQERQRS